MKCCTCFLLLSIEHGIPTKILSFATVLHQSFEVLFQCITRCLHAKHLKRCHIVLIRNKNSCSSIVNYIDRVNISVAAPAMMLATGWDKGRFGLVFSAFLVGYTLLQIPGGILADRWSARKVLALAFGGFSLFTALTPLGQQTFVLLLLLRFLVGAFESMTYPSVTSINSRWIPRREFGRAQTLSVSGASVGQMIAYPLTAWIILQFSWEMVFYANAVLGVIWAAVWLWYAADTPREHPSISQDELHYIESNVAPKPPEKLPVRFVFTSGPILTLAASAMCYSLLSR